MPFKSTTVNVVQGKKSKKIKENIELLQKELDASKKAVKEIEDRTGILESLNIKIAIVESELTFIDEDIEEGRDIMEAVKEDIKELQDQLSQLKVEYKNTQNAHKDDTDVLIKKLNSDITSKNKELTALERLLLKISEDIGGHNDELNDIKNSIISYTDKKVAIEKYIKKNEGIEEQIEKNKQSERDEAKKYDETKKKAIGAVEDLNDILDEISEQEVKQKELQDALWEVENRKVKTESKMTKREALISEREQSVEAKLKKIKGVMKQLRIINPERMANINI